jgi:large subunit ribosomal protein L25
MTISFDLKASERKSLGSSDSRRIRKAGQIPATINSKDGKVVHVTVNAKDLEQEYFKGNIFTTVVNIDLDGKHIKTIPHKIDFNPVTDKPIHVDFVRFEKDQKVKSKVKLDFTNKDKSPGLKKGGFLHIVLRKVELLCDANSIPAVIEVDIGATQVGSKIRSFDLKLPNGAELAKKSNYIIGSVIGRGSKADEDEAKAATTAEGAAATPTAAGAPAAAGAAATPAKGAAAPAAGDKKDAAKKEPAKKK